MNAPIPLREFSGVELAGKWIDNAWTSLYKQKYGNSSDFRYYVKIGILAEFDFDTEKEATRFYDSITPQRYNDILSMILSLRLELYHFILKFSGEST